VLVHVRAFNGHASIMETYISVRRPHSHWTESEYCPFTPSRECGHNIVSRDYSRKRWPVT